MQHSKYICPKKETVSANDTFAFNFAPDDSKQFWDSPDRFTLFQTWIPTYFTSALKGASIKVMIEVSPLGRLHLHGYITISNPMDFYLFTVRNLERYGTFVIKPIADEEIWQKYCTKQELLKEYIYAPIVAKPLNVQKKKRKSKELTELQLIARCFLDEL